MRAGMKSHSARHIERRPRSAIRLLGDEEAHRIRNRGRSSHSAERRKRTHVGERAVVGEGSRYRRESREVLRRPTTRPSAFIPVGPPR